MGRVLSKTVGLGPQRPLTRSAAADTGQGLGPGPSSAAGMLLLTASTCPPVLRGQRR